MRTRAIYLRLLRMDVSPDRNKLYHALKMHMPRTRRWMRVCLRVVGECAAPLSNTWGRSELWGLRYRRVLVSPALESLKHRRRDLTLEGIRSCDERMMRDLTRVKKQCS
jgi:hypothetical protein